MSESIPPSGGMSEFEKKLLTNPVDILGADASKHLSAAEVMRQTLKTAGQEEEAEVLRRWISAQKHMSRDFDIFGIRTNAPHVHGPNCSHGHHHDSGCGHAHSKGAQEPHIPKGKSKAWVWIYNQ